MVDEQGGEFARAISRLCGWLYFIAWSLSFYPQPTLNYQRRTTQGLTPDYPLLNVFGFTSYVCSPKNTEPILGHAADHNLPIQTISTAVFLYSPVVRAQYAARHHASPEPTVRFNDFAFGLHAWILCVLTFSQFWPRLWGWKQASGGNRHASTVTLGLLCGGILGIAICVVIVLADSKRNDHDGSEWAWIDVMYAMTYVKLLLTIFKYIPQVMANYRRKSTVGWSINQVLLDFSGGIFSLLQLVIDSSLQVDWSGLTGNPVKLGLANISLLFDIIFMTQHYVLYGSVAEKNVTTEVLVDPAQRPGTETEPLLK